MTPDDQRLRMMGDGELAEVVAHLERTVANMGALASDTGGRLLEHYRTALARALAEVDRRKT